ncbi:hypothetical protein HMPREF9942_01323 [Fusobacterium animalis F0419]|uniref:Glycosyltransferase 2-like domain-containing protein n=1 Tax=Fusobacterium animalis F0419 TaxID=999414 RepID=H1HFS2_9FUSO|nr:glycosyltransferase [Fusobacterium animalis]EHO77595.1 hypothetical protein HMPREF9942_01323 [Fusobacterium animalis F0419]
MKISNNTILISVVVPIYNAERFLSICIESILNQTFKNFELLLINDGSKDSSLDICNKYLEKFPDKIKIFNNKNMGCSATRNFGIEKSQGKYLLFIDSDDWIEKDMLEKMYQKILVDNSDVVISGVIREDVVSNTALIQNPAFEKNPYFWLTENNLIPYIWNKLYRKSLILNNNILFPINIRLSEDMVFNIKTLLQAKKITVLPKAFYHYIIHGDNTVLNIEKRKDIFLALDSIYEYLLEKKLDNDVELFNKLKELSEIHIKSAFLKLLYSKDRKEFKKYFSIFLKNTKKIKFLNFISRFKVYKRAFFVYLIYQFNLKKIIQYREKILTYFNNKKNS